MPSEDSFVPDPHAQNWSALTDELQLVLAREALRRAADTLADHAELLAIEMETGALRDQGGPDALRLFAAVVRATALDSMRPVGHA
jgi:Mor family transcriptional regulator